MPEEHAAEDWESQFEVKKLLGMRNTRQGRSFHVLWKPCAANEFDAGESTWELESTLREDGRGRQLDAYVKKHTAAPVARRVRATGGRQAGSVDVDCD